MRKKTKLITLMLSAMSAVVAVTFSVASLNSNMADAFYQKNGVNAYSLTLDSSNKVTSAGEHIQHTALGNNVTFTYSNVASSTSGHVTLNANGTLENKDHIRSITSFSCTYSGEALNAQLSYGGDVWNTGFNVISGQEYQTGSNPYFVRFTATSTVIINSISYTYSCNENDAAHEGESGEEVSVYQKVTSDAELENGKYLVVYEASTTSAKILDGSLVSDSIDTGTNYITASISQNKISASTAVDNAAFTLTSVSSGYSIASKNNYFIYHTGSKNTLDVSETSKTNSVSINESTYVASISCGSYSLRFNSASNADRFRYYTSSPNIYLYKLTVTSTGPTYEVPVDCIGFTATDSKANSYKTTDIYDANNGLAVSAQYSDGSSLSLSKGGEDGYQYVVKNSNNTAIDTSKAFGDDDSGSYTVIVSYKNFIPVEINITVEYVVTLTKIEVNSATLTFNTAQKLSDYTSGITANLTYNKTSENVNNLPYASFASKGISLSLIEPSGITHDINAPFGVSGDNWKIKVSDDNNLSVYGELIIVVNAIPVTHIDVTTTSSTTIEEGDTLQLSLSITPNNATNQNVTWASSHEGVATVDASGLVTAVSSSINNGQTTITATAMDGSLVFGSINITVIEKEKAQTDGSYTLLSGTLTVGSYVIFASTDDNGDAYVTGAQSSNIRLAVSTTISSSKIEKTSNSSIHAFLVGEGTVNGSYSFYDPEEEAYLCATSSSSNYLGTQTTLDANGSFTVSGSAEATITAQGSYSRKVLKYNYNGGSTPRFACYATTNTTQTLPAIFVKSGETVYPTSLGVSATSTSFAIGETSQLSVAYSPITTTYKDVTYSSSNTAIATVSSTGLVTAVGEGDATITVHGYNGSEEITTSIVISVSYVYVTGVSIVSSTSSISIGNTLELNASVSPSNATNKNVTWSSSDSNIATVSSTGVVTPKAAGDVTITVTTVSFKNDKTTHATDSLIIHVTSSGGEVGATTDVIDNSETSNSIGSKGNSSWTEFTVTGTSGAVYNVKSMGLNNDSTYALRFNSNGYLYTSAACNMNIVSIKVQSNNALGVGVSSSVLDSNTGSETTTLTSGTFTPTGEYQYLRIWGTTSSTRVTSIEVKYEFPDPIDPTSISISPNEVTLTAGASKTLTVNYTPSNANQNKEVDWSSNNNVVSVDENGKVTANTNATAGQSAVITARLHNLTSIYATRTVTIVETSTPKQTIMIYMCGSDLESGYDSDSKTYSEENGGQASGNLAEILSVANQPDDVNIIVETGGSHYWYNDYGMNASKLERWHVENQTLVKDASLTRTNMAAPSTFQSFVEWGLANYPAQRTGIIMWDHGDGMMGCCSDEYNSSWDMLTENEVKSALTTAYSNKNVNGKLEWIGYDCCLMAMQDIASVNADFFNYQISSQESEPGAGWDYDGFVTPLFNNSNISTVNLLKAVCDSYKAKVRATYDYYATLGSQYSWYSSFDDTTLAIFDLAYMDAYVSAWETMTANLNINSSSKFNTIANYAKQCYAFANTNNNGYGTGTSGVDAYDAYTFLNKIKTNYSSAGAAAVQTAFNNVVIYFVVGSTYQSHAYGMSVFVATYGQTYAPDEYTENDTKFTKWRAANISYGKWYS